MSDKEYHVVDVDLTEAEELKPDVHLESPASNSTCRTSTTRNCPSNSSRPSSLIKSKPALSDEETTACVSTFLAYFQTMQPKLLERAAQDQRPMAYLTATIKAWAEDPDWTQKRLPRPPLEQQSRGTSLRLDPSVRADLQARTLPGMG